MKLKHIQRIMLFLGLILLIYMLFRINLSQLNISSFNLDIKLIFSILGLMLFQILARTIRWQYSLRAINIKIKFIKTYILSASSIAMAIFSPAQSGDLMKIEFLKSKYKIPRRNSLSTVILEKSQDIAINFIIFFIFLLYGGKKLLQLNYSLIIIVSLLSIIMGVIILIYLGKRFEAVRIILDSLKSLIKEPRTMIFTSMISIIYWASVAFTWVLLAKLIHIDISFITMVFIMSCVTIVMVISLIPGAIGAMEASSAVLISLLAKITPIQAILFGLLIRLETIIMFLIGYIHIFFLRRSQKAFKKPSETVNL